MSVSAIIMMVVVQLTFVVVTAYYFIKVLRTPPRAEPDSYSDNDDIPEEDREY